MSATKDPAPRTPVLWTASPAPPVRQYSFTDWQTNNPTAPPPGDRMDAEYDRANAAISQTITWAETSLNTDGSLRAGTVGESQLVSGLFDDIAQDIIDEVQPLVDQAQGFAGAAAASSSTAQAAASAAAGSNTAAQGSAVTASNAAVLASTANTSAQGYATTAQTAATQAQNADNHAEGAAALAQDYADVTQAWAEHMPDTIPPNILAVMGITGDHWSSRWWANQAAVNVMNGVHLSVIISDTPPLAPLAGQLWFDSSSPQLYVWYTDPNSSQWVIATGNAGGLTVDAPVDGNLYGRRNGAWNPVPTAPPPPATLLFYGFVGNGLGTTLGSKFSTLAAAQAVYPHAIALTDTFDWAAIQAMINAGQTSTPPGLPSGTPPPGVFIQLPPGDAVINEPISTGNQSFAMWGSGEFESRIQLTGPVDLFRHGMGAGQPIYYAPFELRNLGIYCYTANAGWMINIRQDPTFGRFTLENIATGANDEVGLGNFLGWVNAVGITTTIIRACNFAGGTFNPDLTHAVQVGFNITSADNSHRAFNILVDNCNMDCVQNCIQANITGPHGNGGSIEGIKIVGGGGTTIAGAYLRVSIPLSADIWQPPFHVFTRWNYQGSGTVLDCDAIQDLHMERCTLYVTAYPTSGTAIPAHVVSDLVRLGHARSTWISENTFHLFANATINSFVSVGLNADGTPGPGTVHGPALRISNNVFDVVTGAIATAGITVDPKTVDVQAFGNRYKGSIWTPLPWRASAGYVANQLIRPTVSNGFIYSCTADGISGIFEPTWPTSAGTVTDGTVTWSWAGAATGTHGIPQTVGPVGGLEAESGLDVTGTFLTVSYNAGGATPTAPAAGGRLAVGTNYITSQAEVDYWNCYAGVGGLSHTFWQLTSNGATPPTITPTRLVDIDRTGNLTAYAGFTVKQFGPTINAGLGAASGTQPKGSLWMRTDGAVGSTLYVSQGAGTWNPVAGV